VPHQPERTALTVKHWEHTYSESRRSRLLVSKIKELFPDFDFNSVSSALDAGCSNLVTTFSYAHMFPHIAWLAVDVRPGFNYPNEPQHVSELEINTWEYLYSQWDIKVANKDFYEVGGTYDLIICDNNIAIMIGLIEDEDEISQYLQIIDKLSKQLNIGGVLAINKSMSTRNNYFIRRTTQNTFEVVIEASYCRVTVARAAKLYQMLHNFSES
jgi:hypothetical protein